MTSTLRAVGRVALTGVLVGTGLLLVSSRASAGDNPEALVVASRTAAANANVAGTVEVRWRDGEQILVERVGARSRGNSYVVGRGDHFAVARDGVRYAADDGVATRWDAGAGVKAPAPGAAWDLELGDPARVAGRNAKVVIARDDAGFVRARLYVDRSTKLLLRRDVFDRDGTLARSVRFTRVSTNAAAPAVPRVPEGERAIEPVTETPDGVVGPERLGGFRLLGTYEHSDGTVQMFYGDGLFSLSVFEQDGLVDWEAMPEGGVRSTVEGARARLYSTAAGTVVVWGERGLVLTGVSDAPSDIVRAVLPDVADDDQSGFQDVVDFVFGPFGWE